MDINVAKSPRAAASHQMIAAMHDGGLGSAQHDRDVRLPSSDGSVQLRTISFWTCFDVQVEVGRNRARLHGMPKLT